MLKVEAEGGRMLVVGCWLSSAIVGSKSLIRVVRSKDKSIHYL
jgi:hypothetical protein